MIPNVLGLFLGMVIGIGCRCFGIPLPGPPKLMGALGVLSVTLGYIGADYVLAYQARMPRRAGHAVTKVPSTPAGKQDNM